MSREKRGKNKKAKTQHDDDSFDLEEWGEGLENEFQFNFKPKERVVTVVPLSKHEFDTAREDGLQGWNPGLSISGDEERIGKHGGGGDFFGRSDCKGAAEFLLPRMDKNAFLYVSNWDFFNPEVDLGDLWYRFDEMLHTAEMIVGPIPGPWDAKRLEKVLQKIYGIMHTEPPDDEPEYKLGRNKVPKFEDIHTWLSRIELQLDSWKAITQADDDDDDTTLTVSIARKGWDTNEFLSDSLLISASKPDAIVHFSDYAGEIDNDVTTYKEVAKALCSERDEWRSDNKYGMYVWPHNIHDEEVDFYDLNQHSAQIGFLEGPWNHERVVDLVKHLWSLVHGDNVFLK